MDKIKKGVNPVHVRLYQTHLAALKIKVPELFDWSDNPVKQHSTV